MQLGGALPLIGDGGDRPLPHLLVRGGSGRPRAAQRRRQDVCRPQLGHHLTGGRRGCPKRGLIIQYLVFSVSSVFVASLNPFILAKSVIKRFEHNHNQAVRAIEKSGSLQLWAVVNCAALLVSMYITMLGCKALPTL